MLKETDLMKVPPQALDMEMAVLGAILIEKGAIEGAEKYITENSFYHDKHQKIYAAIQRLIKKNSVIDILTVANELKSSGDLDIIGGPYYISTLTNGVAGGANIEWHSAIIQQKFLMREVIRISREALNAAYDDGTDVFELMAQTETKFGKLSETKDIKDYTAPRPIIQEILKRNTMLVNKQVLGVSTGFGNLDKVTAGWQAPDLIILAARPGMGKTALALCFAMNAAKIGKPVGIFSLEMSDIQITQRALSIESGVNNEFITKSGVYGNSMDALDAGISNYQDLPIYINDIGGIDIQDIKKKARKMKRDKGIKLLIVDYIQMVNAREVKGNREQVVSTVTRELKALAKELDIPIIALSQLNRAIGANGKDNIPQLSNLRESGAIEQDADIVMFIYRPEYYKITEDSEGNSTKGMAMIMIAKNRSGAIEDVILGWIGHLTKFVNYTELEDYHRNKLQPNEAF